MSAIDVQNAKQIRDPMIISCGIISRPDINLTVSDISGFPYGDTNPSVSLDSEEWPIINLADLQGDGFPLDGSCEFYDEGAGSENGKVGLLTDIGGTGELTVSATQMIPSLTIYTSGEGTITIGDDVYEARGVNAITINATSATITFESADEYRRMEVQTIIPGINISWETDDIISAELYLRSDLSMDSPQWPVSEIEIHAYYPDDISASVSSIADNVPIWYVSGYSGDMAPERRFYLSEPVRMENNILTIRGRDSSHKLGEKSFAAQILNTTSGSGRRDLYVQMMHFIQESGITLRSKESAPERTSGTTERSLIFKSGTADSIIQFIMNLAHTGTYWPTFVDAGIPKLTHTKPTAKWTIREEDCAEVSVDVARNISAIRSTEEYGLHSRVVKSNDVQEIVRRHVVMGTRYSQNAGGYYWALNVSNAYDVKKTAESIWWTAANSTISIPIVMYEINAETGEIIERTDVTYINECVVKGKVATITKLADSVTPSVKRAGTTMVASPLAYGQVFNESVFLFPNYSYLFSRSNITGKFTWKGDPRMQPRDVFNFVRLDGTTETCTIETITLKHSEGGTVAEIEYRQGVC